MRGLEKGWAADVEVAAGRSLGRGLVCVATSAGMGVESLDEVMENGRVGIGVRVALRRAARRRQRRQIIVEVRNVR